MFTQLVFSEIRYHWWIYVIAYLSALLFTLLFSFTGKNITALMLVTLGIFHLVLIATGIRHTREKRDRLVILLPVALRAAAFERIVFVLFFQICLLLLWIVFFMVEYDRTDLPVFWRMLSLNGFIFMYVLIFNINSDLGHYPGLRYRIRFWFYTILVFILFILPVLYLMYINALPATWKTTMDQVYRIVIDTPLSCLIAYILVTVLIILNARIFEGCPSYTT